MGYVHPWQIRSRLRIKQNPRKPRCQLTEPVDANQKRSQNVAAVLIKLATEMHKKKMLHY